MLGICLKESSSSYPYKLITYISNRRKYFVKKLAREAITYATMQHRNYSWFHSTPFYSCLHINRITYYYLLRKCCCFSAPLRHLRSDFKRSTDSERRNRKNRKPSKICSTRPPASQSPTSALTLGYSSFYTPGEFRIAAKSKGDRSVWVCLQNFSVLSRSLGN